MMTIDVHDLPNHAGADLGWSGERQISQEQVDLFADATDDHQWIHTDPERARSGPFGRTIAHGYLSLSLVPSLLFECLQVSGRAVERELWPQ
jgi:acyl dehydratase